MNRIKPDVDVVKDILEAVMQAKPESSFVQSLHIQYQERGGLSKKQLEGLYQKAVKVEGISTGKLATLEAIIMKKTTKYRSPKPDPAPLYIKNEETGKLISEILEKYPSHKRVIYFQSKYNNNEVFSSADITELQKFAKLLLPG